MIKKKEDIKNSIFIDFETEYDLDQKIEKKICDFAGYSNSVAFEHYLFKNISALILNSHRNKQMDITKEIMNKEKSDPGSEM